MSERWRVSRSFDRLSTPVLRTLRLCFARSAIALLFASSPRSGNGAAPGVINHKIDSVDYESQTYEMCEQFSRRVAE